MPRIRRFGVAGCVIWLLAIVAGAAGSRAPSDESLPRIHMHIFLSKDCPHCQPIQKEALAELSRKLGCKALPVYHDVDDMEEYKRLVLLERQYGKTGNDLPVVIMGRRLLGGKAEIERSLASLMRELAASGGCDDVQMPTAEEAAAAFQPARGSREIHVAYFDQPGCRDCLRVEKMLTQFSREFGNLRVKRFSRSQRRNRILLEVLGEKTGVPPSRRLLVPAAFIGRDALVEKGFTDAPFRNLIEKYSLTGADPCWAVSEQELETARQRLVARFRTIGIGSVLLGGLVDGVNPCALATLVFSIGYLATLGRRGRHILIVGGAFSLGVFAAYLGVGFGLSEALLQAEFLPAVSVGLTWAIVVLTFALAAVSLWDFGKALRGKREQMALKLPAALRRRMNLLIARQLRTRNIALAAALLGLAVSLLEFACTGQVYLPLIQFMNSVSVDRARTSLLLVIYNLAFILPLIATFGAAFLGMSSAGLMAVLRRNLAAAKLFMALFFAGLGTTLVILN